VKSWRRDIIVHLRGAGPAHADPRDPCAFGGVYLEKGMGLIVPGFVPSTLHELVEDTPTLTEWKVSAGIWAFGALVLTAGLKAGLAVWTGRVGERSPTAPR
jgi:hypothetical protein